MKVDSISGNFISTAVSFSSKEAALTELKSHDVDIVVLDGKNMTDKTSDLKQFVSGFGIDVAKPLEVWDAATDLMWAGIGRARQRGYCLGKR